MAKLEGVALRCKGLLRKKEAAPAFKLVKYATIGRQDAQQCSSTAASHIVYTRIRQHAIAVARKRPIGSCLPQHAAWCHLSNQLALVVSTAWSYFPR